MTGKNIYLFCVLLLLPWLAGAQVTLQSPASRTVYQRNSANQAHLQLAGSCPNQANRIEARVLARTAGQGTNTDWTVVDAAPANGAFRGSLTARAGWYTLEVRALAGSTVLGTASVDRVGVGEVFIVCGHSVAHGDANTIEGTGDDRVNTVSFTDDPQRWKYEKTASTADLPSEFVQYGTGKMPSPFGYNNYFWSKFGEALAQRLNMPVLIFNAAFGGSNLEHWARSAQNQYFEHGFIRWDLGMPYVNVKNALSKYVSKTGIRALLIDHGQNDFPQRNEDLLLQYYQTWVNKARQDAGHSALAAVINRQTPFLYTDPQHHIRRVQERMSLSTNCFPGPDYDAGISNEDRYDGIHLAPNGQRKAAQLWANALSDGFFASSVPYVLSAIAVNLPTAGALSLLPPTVDCQTGALTFRTSGGDGSTVEFSAPGLTDWTTNPITTIPAWQRNGTPLVLKARQSGREISLNYTTACGTTPTEPTPPPTNRTYASPEGHLDGADCGKGWGWAADRAQPNTSISVDLYVNGKFAGTTLAGRVRKDIAMYLGDNGLHGFEFIIPKEFQQDGVNTIEARFASSTQKLTTPTRTYTCSVVTTPTTPTTEKPSEEPSQPPTTRTYASPEGHLDGADCGKAWGWAADRAQPNTSITVDLFVNGKFAGTVMANKSRRDIAMYLGDNGLHGFEFTLPIAFQQAGTNTIEARFGSSTVKLNTPSRQYTCAAVTFTPAVPVAPVPVAPVVSASGALSRTYASPEGHLDAADCGKAWGWAADRAQPNRPISVDLFINGQRAGTVLADRLRSDVGAYLGDNGLHGFEFTIPAAFRTPGTKTLEARYSGSSQTLNTPSRQFTCAGSNARIAAAPVPSAEQAADWGLFPNPVDDEVRIRVPGEYEAKSLNVFLLTMSGQRTDLGQHTVSQQTIRFSVRGLNLSPAYYLIGVADQTRLLKTLKVLKR